MKKIKVLSLLLIVMCGAMLFSACNFLPERTMSYEIVSDTMSPALEIGDKVKVKTKDAYDVGDIIAHKEGEKVYISRIVFAIEDEGVVYYICRGDNVINLNGTQADGNWTDDYAYIQDLVDDGAGKAEIEDDCGWAVAIITADQIEGYVYEIVE